MKLDGRIVSKELNYEDHRQLLIQYLLAKVACADWHGVADAAMDLRELEAEERGRYKARSVE